MDQSFSDSSVQSFPWWHKYEAVLQEIHSRPLFVHIEKAESTILVRRDAVGKKARYRAERAHIALALTVLGMLKKYWLGFS
jgi:hypothetical protein